MIRNWVEPELNGAQMVENTLIQKLNERDSLQLLTVGLGSEMKLLEGLYDGKQLNHTQACRSLVALYGFQILRVKEVRTAIVGSAMDDQVINIFSDYLTEQQTFKTFRDYQTPHMRSIVANHAWHSGSAWARLFCESFELPIALSGRQAESEQEPFEVVEPFVRLNVLHDFQQELRQKIESILKSNNSSRGLVALPTGAGKTRLLVDTALGLESVATGRNCVLWVAQHEELCEQAVECFSQVWRSAERPEERALRIQRVWKGLSKAIDWASDVIIGTPQSLTTRLAESSSDDRSQIAIAVIDEAHHALAPSYQSLFSLLSNTTIIGITATPGSAVKSGSHLLRKRFGGRLLTADLLGPNPVGELQEREILSVPDYETQRTNYRVGSEILDTDAIAHFGDLPPKMLERLGRSIERNRVILDRLLEINDGKDSVLCFASSVQSSRALAAALVVAGRTARSVDATTERWSRSEAIDEFKNGRLQFLLNYGVLAMGFDAPRVSVLVLARPTTSPILFEQMLGRGLRGPENGGTKECKVIYFEDDFTGFGDVRPLSYVRFLEE